MISILLSAYNGEKYIIEQLKSIYDQTLQPDEVIIIDDNSSDNTYSMCEGFIKQYGLTDKWKLIPNNINKGWKYNFHYGVKYTKGDIIFFSDQDDIWLKTKIQLSIDILKSNPKINVLATYEKDFYENGNVITPLPCDQILEIIDIDQGEKNLHIRSAGCTMAVKRSFLQKIDKYFIETWAHDDMIWKLSAIDGTCALYHDATIMHRIHANNASRQSRRTLVRRTSDNNDMIANYSQVLSYIKDYYPSNTSALKLYEEHIDGMKLRDKFFKNKNIIYLVKIVLRYKNIYQNPKQLLADVLVVLRGK